MGMSRISIPVRELQPRYVVIEELRDGKTGGIVLSSSYAKAISDDKWGSQITSAFNRIQDTKLSFDSDEDDSKIAIHTPGNDTRIQFTMRRHSEVQPAPPPRPSAPVVQDKSALPVV